MSLLFIFSSLIISCTRKPEGPVGTQDVSSLLALSKTTDGKTIQLQDVSQKLIMINFWASWCGPCMEETPGLLKFISENEKNILLVSINEDDSQKNMQSFAKLFPLFKSRNVYTIFDLDRQWSQGLGVYKFPETFIFNKKGKLLKEFEGAIPFQDEKIKSLIQDLTKQTDCDGTHCTDSNLKTLNDSAK